MAILPWTQSSARTGSSDKQKQSALEWFARATAEPSRQALTELMKQHSRTISAGSSSMASRSSKERSRSNTAASQHSQISSTRSIASNDQPIQSQVSPSRSESPSISLRSPIDRSESSKSLFSRAGALRKMSSKMSLSSESISGMAVTSPSRLASSRLGFRRKDSVRHDVESPSSPQSPMSISKPYGFQHVSHSDQDEFFGLGCIDEMELALRFNALQSRQGPDTSLRGVVADDLGVVTPPRALPLARRLASPVPIKDTDLPKSPPKPALPPKDNNIKSLRINCDVRASRSVENFSRPTPRTPTFASTISQSHAHQLGSPIRLGQSPSKVFQDESDPFVISPMPAPRSAPVIGNAVSTQDDTARRMMAAPLPPPPLSEFSSNVQLHTKQTNPPKRPLRHMSTFPSARQSKNDLMGPETHLLRIQEESEPASKNVFGITLPQQTSLVSIHQSNVAGDLDDWEMAIDYAWEHPDGAADISHNPAVEVGIVQDNGSMTESMLEIRQPIDDQVSLPSTPLMMSNGFQPLSAVPKGATGSALTTNDSNGNESVPTGLDVSTASDFCSASRNDSQAQLDAPSTAPSLPYVSMSLASSQESVILSIASSILGTHRSSNSSVSPLDYARNSRHEDLQTEGPRSSWTTDLGSQKAARPESTCVPVALLTGFASTSASTDLHVPSKDESPEADGLVGLSKNPMDENSVVSSPQRKGKAVSDPTIPVPDRTSSVHAPTGGKLARHRANTTTTSRRPARTSYSLFPVTTSVSTS